jgi:ATP-binding cassette subfamily B protein
MKPWWRELLRHAAPQRRAVLLLAALMLAATALELLKPWPLKLIVDYLLQQRAWPAGLEWLPSLPGGASPTGLIAWLALAALATHLLAQTVRLAESWLAAGAGGAMMYALGGELFTRLLGLSVRFHARRPAGELARRVTGDSQCVRDLVLWVGLLGLGSLVSVLAMFAVMWRLDPRLSLVAAAAVLPLGGLIAWFARPMSEFAFRQQQREGETMALAGQILTALPLVQAFRRESHEDRRFRRVSRRTVHAHLRAVAVQLKFKIGTGAVTALFTAAIMVVGGLRVLDGSLTVGGLLVFLAYLTAMYAPLETLAYLSSGFASAAAGARRVGEIMAVNDRVAESPRAVSLADRPGGVRGHVRVEDLRFGYEPARPVLENISLQARPGETIALVGPTGAGKTTLVWLIARLFDPWEGRILLDGVDLREIRLADLRAHIGMVLQEPFLLPLSIAGNIAYGRPDAARADIEAAARAAHADEFIRRLPAGYDTLAGERGARLSGGEKQRIAIARALLKNAPVLILDEPTAALDTQTERLVMDALQQLMRGRTVFVIAHRFSTARRADRVFVLDAGRVVEQGPPDELLRAGGWFARFQHDSLPAQEPRRDA